MMSWKILSQVLVEGALENAQNDKEADKIDLQEKLKRAATWKQLWCWTVDKSLLWDLEFCGEQWTKATMMGRKWKHSQRTV